MSKKILLTALLVLSLCGMVTAQDAKPLQLSLWNPVQIVLETESIGGLSLGLVYTSNVNVSGLSFTLGLNKATGEAKGISWGIINWDEMLFHG